MLHYSFPPFCINEVGKHGGVNRREVGHGKIAKLLQYNLRTTFPFKMSIHN